MGKIVAMGGGELRDLETFPMDARVVELTGKTQPRALFIPTASSDALGYAETFQQIYGDKLGCETDVLWLLKANVSFSGIAEQIQAADLIYVGGGNTLKMLRRWRLLGVDNLLEAAYQRGTVLAGLSAGAICWFAYGHSDSMGFYQSEGWQYIRVRALGLVNAIFCPHLNGDRRSNFTQFMGKYNAVGIGVEDNCAIEIIDGQYRIITSKDGAKAYKIYRTRGQVITQEIEQRETHQPLTALLEKEVTRDEWRVKKL
jgi:dipeptidase E